jgi:hypothetical protein
MYDPHAKGSTCLNIHHLYSSYNKSHWSYLFIPRFERMEETSQDLGAFAFSSWFFHMGIW